MQLPPVIGQQKRLLDNPQQPDPKRRRVQIRSQIEDKHSLTPFGYMPAEVIAIIFSGLSLQDLFNFEKTCQSHLEKTETTWYQLRQQRFFTINCSVCEDHRTNYLLSNAVVNFILSLPKKQATSKKHAKKFEPVCQKFPLFRSLVELTQLPRTAKRIPRDLYAKLKQDPLLKTIADVYQCAIKLYRLRGKNKDHLQYEIKKTDKAKKLRKKRIKLSEKIQSKIEQQIALGATYIHKLTVKIFWSYYLVQKWNHKYDKLFLDLAQKAADKGDLSGYEALRNYNIYSEEAQEAQSLEAQSLEPLELNSLQSINKFLQLDWIYTPPTNAWGAVLEGTRNTQEFKRDEKYTKVPFFFTGKLMETNGPLLEEQQKLWINLQELVKESDMPVDVLHAVFRMHLQLQNWTEADCFLSKILEKEKHPSLFILWSGAKLKLRLNQWEQADAFYDQLKKKKHFLMKHYEEIFLSKMRLKKCQEADRLIDKVFKVKAEPKPFERLNISKDKNLLEHISKGVTYRMKRLEAFQLLNSNFELNQYLKSLTKNLPDLNEQSTYTLPISFAFKLAEELCDSKRFQEAYDLYSQIAKEFPTFSDWERNHYNRYLETMSQLQKVDEIERLLQLNNQADDAKAMR